MWHLPCFSVFTITRIGYHGIVYYKGQLWLDHVQPDIPCEDIKFCYIMKGGTTSCNMFTALMR